MTRARRGACDAQVTSCVFDQTFFFDLPRMTRATLEAGAVALTVLDARFAK